MSIAAGCAKSAAAHVTCRRSFLPDSAIALPDPASDGDKAGCNAIPTPASLERPSRRRRGAGGRPAISTSSPTLRSAPRWRSSAGLRGLPRLEAVSTLTPPGAMRLRVHGTSRATVGQTCVVTLEPIENEINEPIDAVIPPAGAAGDPRAHVRSSGPKSTTPEPEPLSVGAIDLGAIATEFLILASIPIPASPASCSSVQPGRRNASHLRRWRRSRNSRDRSTIPCNSSDTRIGKSLCHRADMILSAAARRPAIELPALHAHTSIQVLNAPEGPHRARRHGRRPRPGGGRSGRRTRRSARHPDTEFLLFGDEASSARCSRRIRGCKAASTLVHTDVAVRMDDKPSQALRKGRWKSSMWLAHRCGEEGRGRCRGFRRQYRRADGDGEVQSADHAGHRAAGDRRALADAARRKRSCSTSAPRSAPTPSSWSISRSWAARWRGSLFDVERPTVGLLNIGVEEVKGLEEVREAGQHPARSATCRISTISASSRATISARARSMSSSPKALPAISRSRRRKARRARSPSYLRERHEPDAAGPARLSARAGRLRALRAKAGSARVEWRRVPRPQRHRHQEPRRHRCRGLRRRDRRRLRHGRATSFLDEDQRRLAATSRDARRRARTARSDGVAS